MTAQRTVYRLTGMDGSPHPVLDTPYESIESALNAAKEWASGSGIDCSDLGDSIGIEVKTLNGSWRTICYS